MGFLGASLALARFGPQQTLGRAEQRPPEAIEGIKRNLPEERWPEQIKGEYEIEWKFDVPSFLEYYSSFISLAGMEKMTGINQKQLSNYLNHRAVPRRRQADRIITGIHRFAQELLSITL